MPQAPLPEIHNAKPFVKWVGGKRSLLPELLSRVPAEFKNYYEPFVGGGYRPGAERWLRRQTDSKLLHVFNLTEFLTWVNQGNL